MKKQLLLTLSLVPLAIFQTEDAWARPSILAEWQLRYPSSSSENNPVECQLCHQNSNGGEPWNAYGWAIRTRYLPDRTDESLLAAFMDAESINSDGDPTTATNLTEIQENTQPGWTPGPNNTIYDINGNSTGGHNPPAELAGIVLDPNPFPDLTATPDNVDFTTVKVGRSGNANVQIANIGQPDLHISSINLCAGTSSEFSWTALSNTVISSGASETLTLSFDPVDTGIETGCLEIHSDDLNNLIEIVNVNGEGINKGGKPGGGGDDNTGGGSKLTLVKSLTIESGVTPNIPETAQNGETLTYTIVINNAGKKAETINVTETVPVATVYSEDDQFNCTDVTEGSSCSQEVTVPGKDKNGNGSETLIFKVTVNKAFNDIHNTVSATNVDCADPANVCTVVTPGEQEDTTAPSLAVLSHADGALVTDTGFIMNGTASDVGGIASISVFDGTSSHPATYTEGNGTWTVNLPPYPGGKDVTFEVTAIDNSGNPTDITIVVQVQATQARHLINRISYGITPSQLAALNGAGGGFDLAAYRTAQLNPTGCLEPTVAQASGSIFDPFLALPIATRNDLQNYAILMAAYNDCQLREVLTQFWDNHFNTDYDAVHSKSGSIQSQTVSWELAENDAFRANALGNFRDLVEISGKSRAMIYYLDGINNIVGNPNENYGRELMELHTMSVDGGYTDADVANVARAFTGWTVVDPDLDPLTDNSVFTCDPLKHDFTDIVLDLGGGVGATVITTPEPHNASSCEFSGQAVYDELIARAVTGEFICEKLTELLVSDNITPTVVNTCETAFTESINDSDQIAQVVEAILTTPVFTNTDDYLDKIKTPLELTAGYLRNFDIVNSDVALSGDLDDLRLELDQMGMALFRFNTPDGFPEQSADWISSVRMQQRFAFISDMTFNTNPTGDIYLDPAAFFAAHAPGITAVEIVDYVMELVLQNQHTTLERDMALDILNNESNFDDGGNDFDTEPANIQQNRLRVMLAVVLNYPGYQYQ